MKFTRGADVVGGAGIAVVIRSAVGDRIRVRPRKPVTARPAVRRVERPLEFLVPD